MLKRTHHSASDASSSPSSTSLLQTQVFTNEDDIIGHAALSEKGTEGETLLSLSREAIKKSFTSDLAKELKQAEAMMKMKVEPALLTHARLYFDENTNNLQVPPGTKLDVVQILALLIRLGPDVLKIIAQTSNPETIVGSNEFLDSLSRTMATDARDKSLGNAGTKTSSVASDNENSLDDLNVNLVDVVYLHGVAVTVKNLTEMCNENYRTSTHEPLSSRTLRFFRKLLKSNVHRGEDAIVYIYYIGETMFWMGQRLLGHFKNGALFHDVLDARASLRESKILPLISRVLFVGGGHSTAWSQTLIRKLMEALLYRVCNMRNVTSNTNLLAPGHFFKRNAPWVIAGSYMNFHGDDVTIMFTNDPMLIRLGRIHCTDFGPSTTCFDLCYEFGTIGGDVTKKRTDFCKGVEGVLFDSPEEDALARCFAEWNSWKGQQQKLAFEADGKSKFVISLLFPLCFKLFV